ncbi:hypothetical protein GlitD10_0062 [Gloeomargarita lithophora Alchichica-D10]|uniref:DUF3370 domain-containing protein n=1 Tax=Gloeomargarita lithophora Alchichica-D10 TaxID=1188229 RepID=A0A1J0A8W3_9CYAN|nr:DUF3370 domain-containing protein [Gloeomargarita lithophora]APB32363.1 hypothetical protein GlitD10_0062 [Gloeomargarita lithophora Alchichica-D10]
MFLPLIAQVPPVQESFRPQEVRPLPGQLNRVPLFNSNSPELVFTEGILLSTFAPQGMKTPQAHLNYRFEGEFDAFLHHLADSVGAQDARTFYLGFILGNPGTRPATVSLRQAASFLTQPDAGFITLPDLVPNPLGWMYSGPGSRLTDFLLRGGRQSLGLTSLTIPPGGTRVLLNQPIPTKKAGVSRNARSVVLRLYTNQPVYAASLGLFATVEPDGTETAPSLERWQNILQQGTLASPRDLAPTPLNSPPGQFRYGRVSGVALGTRWQANLTDPGHNTLAIPTPGKAISYGISLLHRGGMGTGQDQTAPMLVRYPDTAYRTHGNYVVQYNLTLPLVNRQAETRRVTVGLESPLKTDANEGGLRFWQPPARQVFFRGTVRVRYIDDTGLPQVRDNHLVLRRGQRAEPLAEMNITPGQSRLVQVSLLYPPDATPPQMLTILTELNSGNK